MPRPALPPTPMASTEIRCKDRSPISASEKSFVLGPPAIAPKHVSVSPPGSKQPQSAIGTSFTLPPPPTRSRTIIQMKPKPQPAVNMAKTSIQQSPKPASKRNGAGSTTISGKKQPSSTSVTGKRIARKTAHSVIERRRRSKMNDEFSTLKGMIPACTDQEMHKLAILQASIDYLRYLEKCIADLKAANNSLSTPLMQPQAPTPRQSDTRLNGNTSDEEEGEEEAMDFTMDSATTNISPTQPCSAIETQAKTSSNPESIASSPALGHHSRYQTSSYASSVSTLPSPAFDPQGHAGNCLQPHFSLSTSTSPTIMPNTEQDHEATAALLMLNKERRNPKCGRPMSVKDLLSP